MDNVDVRHRFLDRVILPCPLAELNAEQIIAINRFREWERTSDPQFAKAERARQIICRACRVIETSALLEVGMGKFPIAVDAGSSEYFGIDIDPEAIAYCHAAGLQAGLAEHVSGSYDTVVAIYSLHFAATTELYRVLADSAAVDPVMMSVVVDDGAHHFSEMLERLTEIFPLTRVILSLGSRRERFVVSGSIGAEARFRRAVSAVEAGNAQG